MSNLLERMSEISQQMRDLKRLTKKIISFSSDLDKLGELGSPDMYYWIKRLYNDIQDDYRKYEYMYGYTDSISKFRTMRNLFIMCEEKVAYFQEIIDKENLDALKIIYRNLYCITITRTF
jgi:hypothetical protein